VVPTYSNATIAFFVEGSGELVLQVNTIELQIIIHYRKIQIHRILSFTENHFGLFILIYIFLLPILRQALNEFLSGHFLKESFRLFCNQSRFCSR